MDFGTFSQSTTEPNTPEAGPIEDETQPSGNFARIRPISRAARLAFHDLADMIDQNLGIYRWHRGYLHIRDELEPLSDDAGDSTGGEGETSPPQARNIAAELRPSSRALGWVVGKGRWRKHSVGLHGSVDILLTNNAHEQSVHGRHARIFHNLESNSLVIFADRKLRFDGETLTDGGERAFRKGRTSFALGPFEYQLEFTGLSEDVYRAQLTGLAKELNYEGPRPASFTDPTPTKIDYALKDYTIRSSFATGSSCYVCQATDKRGAAFVVKKIIASTTQTRLNVEQEVKTLQRVTEGGSPPSICRFIEYIAIEPSKSSGITQPLISKTLADLVSHSSLPISSRLALIAQTLSGLAFVHSKSCMHRDIKPEKVLASSPPSPLRAVVIDFGAATFAPMSNDHLKGTVRYLAPEIMALKHSTAAPGSYYDAKADVWAMGMAAYEMLSGWRFKGEWITQSVWGIMMRQGHWQLAFQKDEQVSQTFVVVNKMLAWIAGERVTAKEALDHDVFQRFDINAGPATMEHIGNKRPGPSTENEGGPSQLKK